MSTVEATADAPSGLRRAPQQARSQARVQAIYRAADVILARDGVDALTMRRLASDAGVPIGTVYQFFADKSAVLDSLVYRHMDSFPSLFSDLVDPVVARTPSALVDVLFDRQVDRLRRSPSYVALWTGRHLSPELQRADTDNIRAVADVVHTCLIANDRVADTPQLASACLVAIQTADALLQLAFTIDHDGDPTTLGQARHIVRLYLEDAITTSATKR